MPTYGFECETCGHTAELFISFSQYDTRKPPLCKKCNRPMVRDYHNDISQITTSIRKSDSELKTIGDLADRNRDRLSNDQKHAMSKKHNEYKDTESTKALPTGMSRMKKPKNKIRWTK